MKMYKCPFCPVRKFTIQKYLQHLQLSHQHQPNFTVTCGLDGCNAKFLLVDSWRKHISRKHCLANQETPIVSELNDEEAEIDFDQPDASASTSRSEELNLLDVMTNLKQHLGLFMLKLQEKHSVVKKVRETVADGMKAIFAQYASSFCEILQGRLNASGVSIELQKCLRMHLSA
jgi:hypothetical protein